MLLSSKEEHTRMFYRGARCCDSSCERKFGSQMKNSQEGTIALSQLMLPLLFYFYLQLELRKYCIIFFLSFKISQFLFLKFHRGASFYDYSFEKKSLGTSCYVEKQRLLFLIIACITRLCITCIKKACQFLSSDTFSQRHKFL